MKVPRHKDVENDRNLTRKHVAERNRRARINYYLEEIEKLITPSISQNSTSTKLEKAEVLERTVAYLKQHRVTQMNTHQNYVRGFLECIRSIQSLLVTMKVSETDVRHIFHGCLSSVRNRLQRPGTDLNSNNINIMTLNNLTRLKNLESPKSNNMNTTVTSSSEHLEMEKSQETEIIDRLQYSRVGLKQNTPRKVLGVLQVESENRQSSSSKTDGNDYDMKPINLTTNSRPNESDISDNENRNPIDDNDENINPDINYDDPMWRPW